MCKFTASLVFGWVLLLQLAFGQGTNGIISGTVKDSTGAMMPGAKIEITNEETGLSRTVVTDTGGRYTAPSLTLGQYRVAARMQGFETEVREGITLTVGREAVVNFDLKVGAVNQTVEVMGEAPLVESTSSSLGALVDDRTIRDLPLNGRSYDQLALLQPGVVSLVQPLGTAAFDYGTGIRFSVAGSRAAANSFMLDGTDINDHGGATPGGAAGTNLGVDGIREFRILTNAFSAEYGRASGGVITAVTRAGTNQLHGSAFEFLRNGAMDARNFFDVGGVPPFRRNQFGGSLGGPVKKDKTFFFGTYEGLRQAQGTTEIAFVPTVAAKQGILPNGTVAVAPAMQPFLTLYPNPNATDFGDGSGEFTSAPSIVTTEDYFMTRIDHQISEKMNVFGRYSFDNSSVFNPTVSNLPSFEETTTARREYATVQVSNILSPTVLNAFRFAYNRSNQGDNTLPTEPLGPQFSFVPGLTMGTIQTGAIQTVSSAGVRTLASLGTTTTTPRTFAYNLFEEGDDITFVKGRHSFRAGGDFKRIDDNAREDSTTRGVYTFTNLTTLLEGIATNLQAAEVGQNGYRGYRQDMFGVYAQDDFKMSQRLTINLGLRWEGVSDPTEVNGMMSNLLNPLAPQLTVLQNGFFSITKKDFEPRVGFAWQLTGAGTTVLRAGFGIFHDHVLPGTYSLQVSKNPPFYNLFNAANPVFPNGYLTLGQTGLPRLITMAPFTKEPAKNSWNVSLQQQVFKNTVLELAYVGAESFHLETNVEGDTFAPTFVNGQPFFPAGAPRVNPNFSDNTQHLFDTNANYNALQVTLRHKSAAGLQFQAFYTYSKSLDDKSSTATGDTSQEPTTVLDPFNLGRDYGLSTFSAKNSFVGTVTYPFPVHFQQKAAGLLLNGWIFNGIETLRSGEPFTIRLGFNNARDNDTNTPDRPNLVAGSSNDPIVGQPTEWYNPAAFAVPAAGTFGNLGRNTVIGPGLANLDVALEKLFQVRESVHVQFRAELFNILNHANFGLPTVTAFTSSGAIAGSAGVITYEATQPREIQLGLKILF